MRNEQLSSHRLPVPAAVGAAAVQNPAFMWPADRAWCVTGDVDPHFVVIAGPTEAIDLRSFCFTGMV
ncbi:hypothetical protein ACIBM3_32735 [Rhodococcus erythropolis]|uniref:hypothetical protein n=1 Tax=Rhodococcus erythropolis TaxID=1833 RepID=UPI0037B8D580